MLYVGMLLTDRFFSNVSQISLSCFIKNVLKIRKDNEVVFPFSCAVPM